jgi:hypothetical protein
MDSRNDNEMRKLLNWIVWGYSCSDIYGESDSYLFDDSFFVVGKDSLQIFTNEAGYDYLKILITLVANCTIYVMTPKDEKN